MSDRPVLPSPIGPSRAVWTFLIALAIACFSMWLAWVETGGDVSKAGVGSFVVLTVLGAGIGIVIAQRGRRARGLAVVGAFVLVGTTALLLSAVVASWP